MNHAVEEIRKHVSRRDRRDRGESKEKFFVFTDYVIVVLKKISASFAVSAFNISYG